MLTREEVEAGAAYQRLFDIPPPAEAAVWMRERLSLKRPRRRKTVSTEMMIYVAVRCPSPPTADQISALTRNINGSIVHSRHTGLLEMRWRVPSERLLGVATTVPRVLSQALTAAFRNEPEVVSLNVISMAAQ
jgi:hypothetical protein